MQQDTRSSDAKFFQRTESVVFGEDDPSIQRSNEQFFGEEFNQSELMFPPHMDSPHPARSTWGAQSEALSRSLNETYPLASQPHLLHSIARKEGQFRAPRGDGEERKKMPVSYAHHSFRYVSTYMYDTIHLLYI